MTTSERLDELEKIINHVGDATGHDARAELMAIARELLEETDFLQANVLSREKYILSIRAIVRDDMRADISVLSNGLVGSWGGIKYSTVAKILGDE